MGLMKQVRYNEPRHVVAELCAGDLVKAKVLSRIDPAEKRLLRGPGETGKRALYPGKYLRSKIEAELIGSEKRGQRGRCRGANRPMRPGVRGICRRRPRFREEVRVRLCIGISVGVGRSDGSHRPPEGVRVLRVVECDNGIGQGEIQ